MDVVTASMSGSGHYFDFFLLLATTLTQILIEVTVQDRPFRRTKVLAKSIAA
jgi:hypothetical protein